LRSANSLKEVEMEKQGEVREDITPAEAEDGVKKASKPTAEELEGGHTTSRLTDALAKKLVGPPSGIDKENGSGKNG
jgi:hypothetical protein